jgi:hypothetical protein
MLQLPSYLPALAGAAEQGIAEAANSAKAHMRLPIIWSLDVCQAARQFELSRRQGRRGDKSAASTFVTQASARSLPEMRSQGNARPKDLLVRRAEGAQAKNSKKQAGE